MSYIKVSIDLKGKDTTVLSTLHRCTRGLETLRVFKQGPFPVDEVQGAVNNYDSFYESAKTGNRVEILKRNNARNLVTEMFKKIASFLQSVATEEDIPALLEAGFDARVPSYRKKTASAPVAG
ncbi:hypothetical protein [Geomonas edaphica]|uniref:hypothetical protein n=1 Tax=Geomonas edaphica TaxID=2570226 RepID=UPI0010A798EA|nr:hypothetical protein [Geomonas edaphica]